MRTDSARRTGKTVRFLQNIAGKYAWTALRHLGSRVSPAGTDKYTINQRVYWSQQDNGY
jgi:hypothetical protein